MKLLVNAPTGEQQLIEIGDGGGYFDPARILWDERVDGILPEITLGGMVRTGKILTLDVEKLQYYNAQIKSQNANNIQSGIVHQVQLRLDTFAQSRNYDSVLSACTYATSAVPKFAQEGQAAVNARDSTWATLYTILGEVQAGTRPMPSGYSDIESELPQLSWS